MTDDGELEGGVLYVVATPIGNMEDVTIRALAVLRECDALAAEDTRRTRQLLTRYEIPRPRTLLSLHEHNEEHSAQRVVGLLEGGARVALCSDAGTPLVSDPGYRTLKLVVESGFPVRAIPGPSAAVAALAISALPPSSFTFKGFPPRKPGPRKRFLEADAEAPHTLVLFESPHRIAKLLRDARRGARRPRGVRLRGHDEEVRGHPPRRAVGARRGVRGRDACAAR